MPANALTITKSISASYRRSISWLSFTTQLTSDSFQFERSLMLHSSLVVRVAETRFDQAHVDAGALGFFDGVLMRDRPQAVVGGAIQL